MADKPLKCFKFRFDAPAGSRELYLNASNAADANDAAWKWIKANSAEMADVRNFSLVYCGDVAT